MAESWEMLLKHQRERVRQQTIALADRFRSVLFLSEVAANEPAEETINEKVSLSYLFWSAAVSNFQVLADDHYGDAFLRSGS